MFTLPLNTVPNVPYTLHFYSNAYRNTTQNMLDRYKHPIKLLKKISRGPKEQRHEQE